ncbi:sugar 3,4-ketoisomerase [Chlorobium ferrooxidans]|uniref:WxcM-like n=1 Tax=Chlorobium ferrooxidans DSM 13031 TaxID=377431 RepID=Q0YTU1_9CHLB|nr:FdtA/QdtA family cupin domain-containing protein [Chlorobium ferrooxidans]EAT59810.1 WxcM-like [Chlorobium ferrooxidans DSM 13031]
MFYSLDAVKIINLPHYFEDNGDLVVMEGLINVPFAIARVFVVRAPVGAIRGQHAHRACAQFLTCPRGVVDVLCDDGTETAGFTLDHPNIGLLVPPGIWSTQTYTTPGSALTVLCDRPYEVEDYIRDYSDYLAFRRAHPENKEN